ncbi:MAG: aldehyde dehydrogenase family protein, partial [Thermoplasmata archaeon]
MSTDLSKLRSEILKELNLNSINSGIYAGEWVKKPSGKTVQSISPIDGKNIAAVMTGSKSDYELVVKKAEKAYEEWLKFTPPPR